MKLINPILLTLNNTLHIKADNLEPVEVDSSCVQEIHEKAFKNYDDGTHQYNHKFWYHLKEGINISELSDRIQIVRDVNCPVGSPKAFLLPEKEDKETIKTFTITQTELTGVLINGVRYYPIEEIEKAIEEEVKSAEQTISDMLENNRSIKDSIEAALIGFTNNVINNLKK